MTRPKLLVADDEPDLIAELAPLLVRAGYEVVSAQDGGQALELIEKERPDLIILDVLMPRVDGREVVRRLRQAEDWTPVILLTQVGTPAERAYSLHEGADDYLNKPFDPMELIARVQAVLRRTRRGAMPLSGSSELISGELVLDRKTRQASLSGQPLGLTARAFGVLEHLMLHPNELVSRERLLDEVWGWAYPVQTRAVDTRIAEIRKALGDDPADPLFIETHIGYGYRYVAEVKSG